MLSVKIPDTEPDDAKPSTAGGFGKVLGSMQGLQQRLGDFSYGEISIAEAKVKMLVKQLALLRDRLNNLVQLKLSVSEINRYVSEIPQASHDQVNLDSLEKHPQLHAILQASKLARFQSLMKGNRVGADAVSLKTVTAEPPDQALAAKEAGTKSPDEQPQSIDKQQASEAIGSMTRASGDARVGDLSPVAEHPVAPRAHDKFTTQAKPRSLTIPNETITASRDDQGGGQAKDWSFDLDETVLTSSELFTTPINFEFPPETLDDPEPVAKNVSKSKLPPTATITKTPANKTKVIEARAAVTAQAIPGQPAPKNAEAELDESKALVPANHVFDQRLLEDVIKNYGDFAGAANLPATIDTATNIVAVTDTPAKPATAEFAQPTAAERKILNVQKSGDLDRQLKKIIKDYGENDIYQSKPVVSFKTGGIIAFAVLGVVLGVLYLFKAPAAAPTPQTGSVTQPQVADRLNSPEAVKSPPATEHGIGPDAANASSSPLTDGKQKP